MKPKLIYITPWNSAFVQKDIDFLAKHYQIKIHRLKWNQKFLLPLLFLIQFFWLAIHFPRTSKVVIMFGGYHSLLPTVFGKLLNISTYIVLGGTECVSLPTYNYGSLRKPTLKWVVQKSFQSASYLLPVHQSLIESKNLYINDPKFSLQGIKHHFKNLKTKTHVINNGFEIPADSELEKEPNSVITVAVIDNKTRYYLKGIDKIAFLANEWPQMTFRIIGMTKKMELLNRLPSNVVVHDFLPFSEFNEYLKRSEFYLQPSVSEGFPNALAEGMLFECIPIGSAVGGIPEIIGDTGYLLRKREDQEILKDFKKALNTDQQTRKQQGNAARKRIMDHYPIQKRAEKFLRILQES